MTNQVLNIYISEETGYQNYLKKRDPMEEPPKIPQRSNELENWPDQGKVEFQNYSARYRGTKDPVLKGIDITINPQEKVGLVGRTGAGKSSLTLCLLRVLEAEQGSIVIDGIDISKLSLQELRSKITIILQDSNLFEGTIRENIDPLSLYTDEQIITTLEKCKLGKLIDQRSGLQTEISDGGDNLSAGEKQIICIVRAILKKNQIVLIDEATANIDIETEQFIQKTIKQSFENCTVITIAHRINTILSSDKVLVFDKGYAVEFDHTSALIANQNSSFYNYYMTALQENKM